MKCASPQMRKAQAITAKGYNYHLRALGNAGYVGALVVGLAASYGYICPGPASAGALSAGNDDVVATAGDITSDVVERQTGNGNASISVTVEVTTVVVLFDEDAILGDLRQGNVFVGDLVNLAGRASASLDAHAVDGLGNLGVREGNRIDRVVVTTTDRADGETVSTRAEAVLEGDVLSVLLAGVIISIPRGYIRFQSSRQHNHPGCRPSHHR